MVTTNVQPLLEAVLDRALARWAREDGVVVSPRFRCVLEEPLDRRFGDATCRVAMSLARETGRPAHDVAAALVRRVEDPQGWLDRIDAEGPGFVNLQVSLRFWTDRLQEALAADGATAVAPSGSGSRMEEPPMAVRVTAGVARDPRASQVAATLERLVTSTVGSSGPRHDLSPPRAGEARGFVVAVAGEHPDGLVEGLRGGGIPADRTTVVRVGPTMVVRRGRPVEAGAAAAALAAPAARLVLAVEPPAAVAVVDVERVESARVENPLVAVHHALRRLAATTAASPPGDVARLDDGDRECLRLVGTLDDAIEWSLRCGEPERIGRHVVALAAATHRYYNRRRLEECEVVTRGGREALLCGVERTLRRGLALLGIEG